MTRYNGTSKNDVLTGSKYADGLFGYAGNDTLSGGAGDDYIHGGPGVDRLFGGAGNDRLNSTTEVAQFSHTSTAVELLDGGAGSDSAHIDVKGSFVDGMPTQVVYMNYSSPGTYSFFIDSEAGYGAAPLATAVSVESFVLVPDGPVLSYIGNIGGTGSDLTVTATNGNDYFCAGGENNTTNLLGGNDTAIVGTGHDVFSLGDGADQVNFSAFYNGARDGVITDFKVGEDHLMLEGWTPETLTVTNTSGGTWLSGGDDQLFLAGVTDYNPWETAIA